MGATASARRSRSGAKRKSKYGGQGVKFCPLSVSAEANKSRSLTLGKKRKNEFIAAQEKNCPKRLDKFRQSAIIEGTNRNGGGMMDQVLKDNIGRKIGEIKDEGTRQVIYDPIGRRLGYFDGRYTYDNIGRKIGEGNLLTMLLK